MRRAVVALAVVVATLLSGAAGCARPVAVDDGVAVHLAVTPQPPVVGTAAVEVRLTGADGAPLAATAVELEGNMAHAGMRPSFATARPDGPGRWRADLELTMAGDWSIGVRARLEDGREIERTLPLPGVEPR